MEKRCVACRLPDERRAELDGALVAGSEPLQSLAVRFGTSKSGLFRHQGHIKKALVKAAERKRASGGESLLEKAEQHEAAEVLSGDALLAQIVDIQKRTLAILTAAEKDDPRTALMAVHQARENTALLLKLLAELRPLPGLTPAELMALSDEELDDMLRKAGLPIDELDRAVVERPDVPIPAAPVLEAHTSYLGTGQSSAGHLPPAVPEPPAPDAPPKPKYHYVI